MFVFNEIIFSIRQPPWRRERGGQRRHAALTAALQHSAVRWHSQQLTILSSTRVLTSQINIILPGATRLLPKLYVFLAAGASQARLTRRACKKSHYVDIYLIQFSVPYVFKRLKKQIRYSRHGEDIFQCSFMSVFFGNNVQCGVVHCAIYCNVGSQP